MIRKKNLLITFIIISLLFVILFTKEKLENRKAPKKNNIDYSLTNISYKKEQNPISINLNNSQYKKLQYLDIYDRGKEDNFKNHCPNTDGNKPHKDNLENKKIVSQQNKIELCNLQFPDNYKISTHSYLYRKNITRICLQFVITVDNSLGTQTLRKPDMDGKIYENLIEENSNDIVSLYNEIPKCSLLQNKTGICYLNSAIQAIFRCESILYFLENVFDINSVEHNLKNIFSLMCLGNKHQYYFVHYYSNIFYYTGYDFCINNKGGSTIEILIRIFTNIFLSRVAKQTLEEVFYSNFKRFILSITDVKIRGYIKKIFQDSTLPLFYKGPLNKNQIIDIVTLEMEQSRHPANIIPIYINDNPNINFSESDWIDLKQEIRTNNLVYELKSVTFKLERNNTGHAIAYVKGKTEWEFADDNIYDPNHKSDYTKYHVNSLLFEKVQLKK